jgi:hypothetical protein
MSASFISAAICIGVIGLNLLATAAVLREERLSDARRMVQLVAIWVLPVIGAIVVLFLHPGNRVTGPLAKDNTPLDSPPEALPASPPPAAGTAPGSSGDSIRP